MSLVFSSFFQVQYNALVADSHITSEINMSHAHLSITCIYSQPMLMVILVENMPCCMVACILAGNNIGNSA